MIHISNKLFYKSRSFLQPNWRRFSRLQILLPELVAMFGYEACSRPYWLRRRCPGFCWAHAVGTEPRESWDQTCLPPMDLSFPDRDDWTPLAAVTLSSADPRRGASFLDRHQLECPWSRSLSPCSVCRLLLAGLCRNLGCRTVWHLESVFAAVGGRFQFQQETACIYPMNRQHLLFCCVLLLWNTFLPWLSHDNNITFWSLTIMR